MLNCRDAMESEKRFGGSFVEVRMGFGDFGVSIVFFLPIFALKYGFAAHAYAFLFLDSLKHKLYC